MATAMIEEVETVSGAVGVSYPPYGALMVAAWRGRGPNAPR
ncbi:hypothetical protein [Streptomyces sp. NPDC086010]